MTFHPSNGSSSLLYIPLLCRWVELTRDRRSSFAAQNEKWNGPSIQPLVFLGSFSHLPLIAGFSLTRGQHAGAGRPARRARRACSVGRAPSLCLGGRGRSRAWAPCPSSRRSNAWRRSGRTWQETDETYGYGLFKTQIG